MESCQNVGVRLRIKELDTFESTYALNMKTEKAFP